MTIWCTIASYMGNSNSYYTLRTSSHIKDSLHNFYWHKPNWRRTASTKSVCPQTQLLNWTESPEPLYMIPCTYYLFWWTNLDCRINSGSSFRANYSFSPLNLHSSSVQNTRHGFEINGKMTFPSTLSVFFDLSPISMKLPVIHPWFQCCCCECM